MTIYESESMARFVSEYVTNALTCGAEKFEKVSYEQFKKDFMSCLGTQCLVAGDYLPYRISGEYDSSAVDTMVRKIYDEIQIPKRSTSGSAGYDFFLPLNLTINYSDSIVVPTGIKCEINNGWFLNVLPRSSHGFKFGIRLSNTVGIIDSDYYDNDSNEGHIMVKLVNESVTGYLQEVKLNQGDAFCQGILIPYGVVKNDVTDAVRTGGFGSTNK